MMFVVFTVLLWLLALFHVWDHRRFEHDLARVTGPADVQGDWRVMTQPAGVQGLALRRAFRVTGRADVFRYAMPVVFFALLLIGLKSWFWAGLYLCAIVIKWFCLTVVWQQDTRQYAVYAFNRRLFSASVS